MEATDFKGKKVALFCCYKGYQGKTIEKMREKLSGCEVLGELEFREPIAVNINKAEQAESWALSVIYKITAHETS